MAYLFLPSSLKMIETYSIIVKNQKSSHRLHRLLPTVSPQAIGLVELYAMKAFLELSSRRYEVSLRAPLHKATESQRALLSFHAHLPFSWQHLVDVPFREILDYRK